MRQEAVFESKAFYLWVVASGLAILCTPFMVGEVGEGYWITALVIFLLIAGTSVRKFTFYNNRIVRTAVFRPFFRKKQYAYDELLFVEIRKRKEPYQRPYINLHVNPKRISSIFFAHRAFIFSDYKELKPLILHLIRRNVAIRLNMTKEYPDEFTYLSELVLKNNGKLLSAKDMGEYRKRNV